MTGGIELSQVTKGADSQDGQPIYTCTVYGTHRTFTGLAGTTGSGLKEFKVEPPIA